MRYASFCGKNASVIALGTMDFGGKIEKSKAFDFLDAYVEMGGNFIDTARVYGHFSYGAADDSEGVVGGWMDWSNSRDKLVLSTKGGFPDVRSGASRLDRGSILYDIQTSLDALYTDYVDVYWLHRDEPARPVGDMLETLTEIKERGWAKYVGVSNWTAARIREANAYAQAHGLTEIYADQPQFSLARQVNVEDPTLAQMDETLWHMHAETRMPCVCFTSQAKGFLSKMAEGGEAALGDKAKRRYLCAENMELLERVKRVSTETGLGVNSVALAYLTCQPFPCFPIAGASRLEQVLAIREAGDARLAPEQIDFLRKF